MIDTPHPRTTPDVNQTVPDFDRVYEVARQALRHQRDFAVEFRIRRPDGTVKYLEATGHPLFSTRGELFEVLATQVEVADRRYAQEHARLRELESALAHMNRLSIMESWLPRWPTKSCTRLLRRATTLVRGCAFWN